MCGGGGGGVIAGATHRQLFHSKRRSDIHLVSMFIRSSYIIHPCSDWVYDFNQLRHVSPSETAGKGGVGGRCDY